MLLRESSIRGFFAGDYSKCMRPRRACRRRVSSDLFPSEIIVAEVRWCSRCYHVGMGFEGHRNKRRYLCQSLVFHVAPSPPPDPT